MDTFFRLPRWVFLASLTSGAAAALADAPRLSLWLSGPALFISAWAALGHVATLDDDYPGEWSNAEGSPVLWRRSLLALSAKLCVLASFVFWQYTKLRSR
jgi:hypothetical protein